MEGTRRRWCPRSPERVRCVAHDSYGRSPRTEQLATYYLPCLNQEFTIPDRQRQDHAKRSPPRPAPVQRTGGMIRPRRDTAAVNDDGTATPTFQGPPSMSLKTETATSWAV